METYTSTPLSFLISIKRTDIINLAFYGFLQKISTKFLIGLLIFYILLTLLVSGDARLSNFFISLVLLDIAFLLIPLIVYFKAKNNYNSEKKFHHPIMITTDQEKMEVSGEGFNSSFSWSTVHKVAETKRMFILYHSKNIGMPIPKRELSSEQILQFRQLLKVIDGLKVKLLQ